jgi:hypothetical protein
VIDWKSKGKAMRKWIIGVAALSVGMLGEITFLSGPPDGRLPLLVRFAAESALAAPRNVARRTSRRTTRRVANRTSIAGCSPYNAYYNCGGVYYRPVVESGTTVYVVVNP